MDAIFIPTGLQQCSIYTKVVVSAVIWLRPGVMIKESMTQVLGKLGYSSHPILLTTSTELSLTLYRPATKKPMKPACMKIKSIYALFFTLVSRFSAFTIFC
jgi:hypothetical protein